MSLRRRLSIVRSGALRSSCASAAASPPLSAVDHRCRLGAERLAHAARRAGRLSLVVSAEHCESSCDARNDARASAERSRRDGADDGASQHARELRLCKLVEERERGVLDSEVAESEVAEVSLPSVCGKRSVGKSETGKLAGNRERGCALMGLAEELTVELPFFRLVVARFISCMLS
eukprot:1733995-Pleurochrysis_carterae.AAC.4